MLDAEIRRAILALRAQGHGLRKIARALGVSRNSVRAVLASGVAEVPRMERQELADEHLERIRQLHEHCKGNLVRVQEELKAKGLSIAYSTLTAFCRRHGIGGKPNKRIGRYHFGPGQEMQHDTSPHVVEVGGRRRRYECASLVLCYSRMVFAQLYPNWNRFQVKVFLTEALQYLDGAARRCMLDNHSVIIAHGTGADAIPAPEMEAFAERFGFRFVAHEVGDVNRSARVERPFHYVENNFYPGRSFSDLDDLNHQLRAWCHRANQSFKRHLRAKPVELYAAEKPRLRPLPLFVPEVYELHARMVDLEGYVTVHNNRYSVAEALIGRRIEVRETKDKIRIFDGIREHCLHRRREPNAGVRCTLPEHRRRRHRRERRREMPPQERALRAAGDELQALVDALQRRYRGRAVRAVRRLHQMYLDYPDDALRRAVTTALGYGLLDLDRIERMILRSIAGDFFQLSKRFPDDDDG